MDMTMDDVDIWRFMKKVKKLDDSDACWLWTAVTNQDGYGNFKLNGTMVKAHRVAYTMFHGPIPKGHVVMHSCDNPSCVAPHHLSARTPLDNARDREAKGRGHEKRGEFNGRAKLTLKEVWQIRDLHKCGLFNQIQIGEFYEISNTIVSKIVRNDLWKDGANPYEHATN